MTIYPPVFLKKSSFPLEIFVVEYKKNKKRKRRTDTKKNYISSLGVESKT